VGACHLHASLFARITPKEEVETCTQALLPSGSAMTLVDALTDWRKLGQGLHARFVIRDFGAGLRFFSAISEAGKAAGHYPEVKSAVATPHQSFPHENGVRRHDRAIRCGSGVELRLLWVA
jgi:hypothetical protein